MNRMMRFSRQAARGLVLLVSVAAAGAQDWRNADAPFEVKPGVQPSVNLKWVVVTEVQRHCEQESRKRGLGGFGYALDACAFWQGNSCTIVTSTRPTLHQLGHEVRHCFQGNFH